MTKPVRAEIYEISVEQLRSIAMIVGPQSAAARALAEYLSRSQSEPGLAIMRAAGTLIVGPRHTH